MGTILSLVALRSSSTDFCRVRRCWCCYQKGNKMLGRHESFRKWSRLCVIACDACCCGSLMTTTAADYPTHHRFIFIYFGNADQLNRNLWSIQIDVGDKFWSTVERIKCGLLAYVQVSCLMKLQFWLFLFDLPIVIDWLNHQRPKKVRVKLSNRRKKRDKKFLESQIKFKNIKINKKNVNSAAAVAALSGVSGWNVKSMLRMLTLMM